MPKHRPINSIPPSDDPPGQAAPTLETEWLGLITSGRAALDSELAFQKARITVLVKLATKAALWAGLVLVLVFFVLMALVVGALLGLAAWLGPWVATLAVMLALLVATGLSALVVIRKVKAMGRIFGDEDAA